MLTDAQSELQSLGTCLRGTPLDRLLLAGLLGAVILAWLWIDQQLNHGDPVVRIYHGQRLLAIYPLPRDTRVIHFRAKGSLGEAEIAISREGVRMLHAPCNSQRCVRSGIHHRIGDMIICVPNRILVSIEGDARPRLDGIAE
ncbi:MAG: NusG domain II-containing protein [Zetaproteobacteria bacterium]|nr:MAG: NusG domain II-containing protein [Zetaproteobacteria bacterium]